MKAFSPWLLALLLLVSCGSHDRLAEHGNLPTVDVKVTEVKLEIVPIFEQVVGTVTARQQANVAAKVSGRLVTMLASAGKTVKKGELLAEIEVNETRAVLDRAQAALAQANKDFKRHQNLLAEAAVTQAEFDRIEAQQRMALASVQEVQSALKNASVMAPFDGVIIRKIHEEGDLATPSQPLFVMETVATPQLEISVPESLIRKIEVGTMLLVDLTDTQADLKCVVGQITPSAEPASHTYLVKLDLPENASIRVGQFGRARVPRGERKAFFVPPESIFQRGQMDYVFLADQESARLRIVRLGVATVTQTEVLAGIGEGDSIVLNPSSELRDGQPINVRP